MNNYAFRPPLYYTMMFLHPNSHFSYNAGRFTEANNSFFLPPIQVHNFSSRPLTYYMDGQMYYPQEYHHFYGVNPFNPMPNWYYPRYNMMPPYIHLMNSSNTLSRHKQNGWPEGFTMKGELHWGKLERVFGLKRDLPEFVKDDLRRVYGTYPRTFVAITYQNGEYLVRGDPKVGEQEYIVEKKVVRKASTPTESEDVASEGKRSKKKKKGR
ncbi:hypothetical protein GDO86_013348 [Hymenochirus boettgeri]|uniref:Uncharacterized protein n=1 Tax=Hymenochirus boettgeri TaxID=247094 RepID=A0A8T2IUE8_9PIPI|nr:hypothetical protein GDO86_013348 [Hymenochirus boettgeri]